MDRPPKRGPAPSQDELILAVLREVLARQAALLARAEPPPGPPEPVRETPAGGAAGPVPTGPAEGRPAVGDEARQRPAPGPEGGEARPAGLSLRDRALEPELDRFERLARSPAPGGSGLRRLIGQLCLGLAVAAVLINVPLIDGLPLARALPDARSVVVRDGLVLKGSGPRVYVLQDNQRRWISSLDAFEHFGYDWDQVHVVREEFLDRFPEGRPIHVLLKCPDSPHIYRLEDDAKRWIRDIEAFEAEGHVWEDVDTVTCGDLARIPLGSPIPADAGTPEPDASTSSSYPGPDQGARRR